MVGNVWPEPAGTLGPYLLIERLSRGRRSELWRATKRAAGGWEKEVALELLPTGMDTGVRQDLVEHFELKARILAFLDHANLVRSSAFGCERSCAYIEYEWVEGASLESILQRRSAAVPASLALSIVQEILQGLAYALIKRGRDGSPLGLIHSDLRPAVVLCSLSGEVKLAGFGEASIRSMTGAIPLQLERIGYLAPEEIEGRPPSPASDVFATGVILWELLAGTPLFGGADDERLRRNQQCVVPPLGSIRPDVPQPVELLVRRMLTRNPADRFSRAAEALEALLTTPVGGPGATKIDLQRFIAAGRPTDRIGAQSAAQAPPRIDLGGLSPAATQAPPAILGLERPSAILPATSEAAHASDMPEMLETTLRMPKWHVEPQAQDASSGRSGTTLVIDVPPAIEVPAEQGLARHGLDQPRPIAAATPPPPIAAPTPNAGWSAPSVIISPTMFESAAAIVPPSAPPPVGDAPPLISIPQTPIATVRAPVAAPTLSTFGQPPRPHLVVPLSSLAPGPSVPSAPSRPSFPRHRAQTPLPSGRSLPKTPRDGTAVFSPRGPDEYEESGLPPPTPPNERKRRLFTIAAGTMLGLGVIVLVVIAFVGHGERARAALTAHIESSSADGVEKPAPDRQMRRSGTARLEITVIPPDAIVAVAGRRLPGHSPFVLSEVDTRWPVRIHIERDGYRPQEMDVAVKPPRTTLPIRLLAANAVDRGATPTGLEH